MSDGRNAEAIGLVADQSSYKWGFSSDIEQDFAPKGLSEDTVRFISMKKREPQWMLDWRLKAYARWLKMVAPDWPSSILRRSTIRTPIITPRPR